MSRHRLQVSLLAILLVLCLRRPSAAAPSVPEQSAPQGFVFLHGAYVPPPYDFELVDGDVFLNGQLLRGMPAADDQIVPPPDPPQDADDLAALAQLRYHDLGDAPTDENVAALRALLQSYPATANVQATDDELTITDQEGEQSLVSLLVRPAPAPAEILAGQQARADEWRTLLASGGGLLVAGGVSLTVPSGDAASFLQQLQEILAEPPESQAAALHGLLGDPPLEAALLVAGAPARAFPAVAGAGRPATARPPLAADADSVSYADSASHQLSETPKSRNAYLFLAESRDNEVEPVARAAELHGYFVHRWEPETGLLGRCVGPGGATLANFLSTSRNAGILYITSHGSGEHLWLERHCSEAEARAAAAKYVADGLLREKETDDQGNVTVEGELAIGEGQYVAISGAGIRNHWKDAYTIVQVNSCWALNLAGAFAAREFIGTSTEVKACFPPVFNPRFWDALAGLSANGRQRNVRDAFAQSGPQGNSYELREIPDPAWTVLSPAVAAIVPGPGNAYTVGAKATTTVTFDAPLRTDFAETLSTPGLTALVATFLSGSCNPQKIDAVFRDRRTLVITWQPQAQGDVTFRLDARVLRSDDNLVELDGNQGPLRDDAHPYSAILGPSRYPIPMDHVDGNGDDEIWQARCVPAAPATQPTPPPTPTDTPPQTQPQPQRTPAPQSTPAPNRSIGLQPSTAPQGGQVDFDLEGFTPGQTAVLLLDRGVVATTFVQQDGTAFGQFTVPRDATLGGHVVTATTPADGGVSTTLLVIPGRGN